MRAAAGKDLEAIGLEGDRRHSFTRPAPARTATPVPRTIVAPKPARPVEVVENFPMGFMAGLPLLAVFARLTPDLVYLSFVPGSARA